jgi:glycine cleavage system H protein
MNIPDDLMYTEDHEWVGQEGDLWVVGITDFAQHALGDITYVELPDPGRELDQHEEAAVVESVKAASDVYAPVAGTVAEVNEALEAMPELVNKDPYGEGWFFKLEGASRSQLGQLMNAEGYKKFLATLED